ncbi:putative membrane protein (TIGR04086 family) [Caldicoprobacter guelmensis]|uniref:TIGR04086 family membrane protein n=1 Tax=Caldicoprobacter guelmensis TaxID=1170224 RepID=UPI001956D35A|nr:TIGR04086 family membrane protein [Caldicoprobacter guelmensis]MBM7582304.1 putative membrane protein (TIGR04086 family) [Caldicoprobacter guelmensis]
MRSLKKNSVQLDKSGIVYTGLVILKASLLAVIVTLLGFMVFAVVMKLANLQETIIPPVNQAIRIISIALGGALAARSSKTKGWLKGALTGLLYIVWALVISAVFGGKYAFDKVLLSDALLGIVVGAIGGIIGINLE